MPTRGVILDVDGVLWLEGHLAPRATDLLAHLDSAGIPYCLLTNDASVSRQTRAASLNNAGLHFQATKLITAPIVTAHVLYHVGLQKVLYLGAVGPAEDLSVTASFVNDTAEDIEAVVVGDMFETYHREDIDLAVKAIGQGAELIAIQKNPVWYDGRKTHVDNGFWVAALEFVTGKTAVVAGKPSQFAYHFALSQLNIKPSMAQCAVMISDNIDSDLRGAHSVGIKTIHLTAQDAVTNAHWLDAVARDLDGVWGILSDGL